MAEILRGRDGSGGVRRTSTRTASALRKRGPSPKGLRYVKGTHSARKVPPPAALQPETCVSELTAASPVALPQGTGPQTCLHKRQRPLSVQS